MVPASWDVVVVGAGPAGSVVAARLAAMGWNVALVDENEGPRRDIICSGIVGDEAFQRFDLPRDAVVDMVRRGRFVSPSGVEVSYEPPDPPLAYVVDRRRFDEALTQRARRGGAILVRGHAGRRVWRSGRHVHLGTQWTGGEREFRARSLVVATGHQRWLHEPAGLGVPTGYVHGVHADLAFSRLDGAELYFGNVVAPGYFAWTVPYGSRRARLGTLAAQGARAIFREFLNRPSIAGRLLRRSEGANGTRPIAGGPSRFGDAGRNGDCLSCVKSRGIVQGAVRPSYADRVLAVGEAAGQVKTTTAGGIYYGLIGADLAAEVLDVALRRDRLDARFLARYEERWWARLGAEIESGLELQRLGRRVDDPHIDELFTALNDGLGSAVRRLVRFDWHRPVLRELFRHDLVRRAVRGRATLAVGQG